MRCVDVNVLVYAHRADVNDHPAYRDLLERLANDDEPLGIPDLALAGFVRVITNRRVFTEPTSPDGAWAAVENNATWLSADRGFARFRRLRWSHPLEIRLPDAT